MAAKRTNPFVRGFISYLLKSKRVKKKKDLVEKK